jgi:hypothetical protein
MSNVQENSNKTQICTYNATPLQSRCRVTDKLTRNAGVRDHTWASSHCRKILNAKSRQLTKWLA